FRVVLLVNPEPGERRFRADERQRVRGLLLVDVAKDSLDRLNRRHEQAAAGNEQSGERLESIPRPGLDALGQRVVDSVGYVHVLGRVPRSVRREVSLRMREGGEVLGGDAVALRTVAVAAEGDSPPPGLSSAEHDPARDPRRQILLEDSAIYDLTDQG